MEKIIKKLKEIHDLKSKDDNEKLKTTASGLVLNISLDNGTETNKAFSETDFKT